VKLKEEMDELLNANSIEGKVEEMADLLEVVYAYCKYVGVNPTEVERVRKRKHVERGGFSISLLLEFGVAILA
jgi:predicted house-cleaning noncanonical NTP pyrophosphatase (MazG superfamily)